MTSKQLNLSLVPLAGRSKEVEVLNSALHDVLKKRTLEAVLLRGPSGMGKSFLVEQWYQTQKKAHSNIIFVTGKYDQFQQSGQPYAGIVNMIDDLLDYLPSQGLSMIKDQIVQRHLELLAEFFPRLDVMEEIAVDEISTAFSHSSDLSRRKQQIIFAMTDLLRVIASVLERVAVTMLLIDDIQWADENSLELIQFIMSDHRMTRFLLVLASREHDRQVESALEDAMSISQRTLRKMTLERLDLESINDVVSSALESEPSKTVELSEVVFEKTNGHPLCVTRYLATLYRSKLLYFDVRTTYRWCWADLETIRIETDLSDDVAAGVLERAQSLDDGSKMVLQIAAYLGSSFSSADICAIFKQMNKRSQPANELQEQPHDDQATCDVFALQKLDEAVQSGLLSFLGKHRYRFAHDSIQQSFLEMSATSDYRHSLGQSILWLYRSQSPKERQQWRLFAAVHALNQTKDKIVNDSDRIELVMLNQQTGGMAANSASFQTASYYFENAIGLLEQTCMPWKTHSSIMKTVYSQAAMVECACGRHERVMELTDALLRNNQGSEVRISAFLAKSISLQAQGELDGAFEYLLKGLEQLDVTIPKKATWMNFKMSTHYTKQALKKYTDDDILSLPILKDRKKLMTLKFLSLAFLNAYLRFDDDLKNLIMQRILCMTLHTGLSKYAPLAFAAYAVQVGKNDFDMANRYGQIAHRLIQQLSVKQNLAMTMFFLATHVDHLKNPMNQSLRPLSQGFDAGMEAGDIDGAFLCASATLSYKIGIGASLQELCEESEKFFRLARTHRQEGIVSEFLIAWQFALNLQDKNANPMEFDGKTMGEETVFKAMDNGGGSQNYLMVVQICVIAYMGLAEAPETEQILTDFYNLMKNIATKIVPLHYNIPLMCTLTASVMYRRYKALKDKKCLKRADYFFTHLKSWCSKGGLNGITGFWLLEAQHAVAMDHPFEEVKRLFDRAIAALRKTGLRSMEALAHESFGKFALEADERVLASDYLEQACSLYAAWGAKAKVARLVSTLRQHSLDIPGDE